MTESAVRLACHRLSLRLIQIATSWRKNSVSVLLFILPLSLLSHFIVAARKTWRSPIYSFFKPNVAVEIHKGHISHFFRCATKRCKTDAMPEAFDVIRTRVTSPQQPTSAIMQSAALVKIASIRLSMGLASN